MLDKMDCFELLGRGSYGNVFKETIKDKKYAVKQFKDTNINNIDGFLPEIDMITRIEHPNVIKSINFELRNDNNFYLTMELAVCLEKALSNPLNFIIRLNYIHNVGCGVNFIMKSGYFHCDLKNPNILVIDGVAKLADFGLVLPFDKDLRGSTREQEMCETTIYKSPEHILHKSTKITEMSEIWSYGYIVLSIIYNSPDIVKEYIERIGIINWDVTPLMKIYKKNNNPIETFIFAFGIIPEEFNEIIKDVGELQEFDASKRTKDLTNFLKHPLFKKNNIFLNENIGIIKLPNNEILAQKPKESFCIMLDILSKWIIGVCLEFKIRIQPMCLGIEFLRRIIHKYELNEDNMQLFGISCLFLAEKVTTGVELTDKIAVEVSDGAFTKKEFKQSVYEIMSIEKGAISYTTIYEIVKSEKAFIESLKGLLDSSIYYREDMRSSSNIGRYFLNKYPPKLGEKNISIASKKYFKELLKK